MLASYQNFRPVTTCWRLSIPAFHGGDVQARRPALRGDGGGLLVLLQLGSGALVLAIAVGALDERAGLQPLLDHVGAAALGALLGDRLAPGDELAIGVAVAAVEGLALLGAALDDVAFAAFGTFDADQLLLDVLAGRVVAAGGEFAETAVLDHQVVAAVGALLIERLIGLLLLSAELLRSAEHTSELQS